MSDVATTGPSLLEAISATASTPASTRVAHVAICIATFRRPELLFRLLDSIRHLDVPPEVRVEVRVVDNDSDESARDVVGRFSDLEPHYAVQPERNIALTRNRALEMGPADYVAFIDDDEQARPEWLRELLDRVTDTDADAVFGPVCPRLPIDAPAWAARSGLFEKRVECRGPNPLSWEATRTANTLVRGSWFFDRGMRFDPAFGRSGGEDTDLFRRMQGSGARFCAAPNAIVDETVHIEQCRLRWFLRRHYRGGANYERHTASGSPAVLARAAKRLAGGTLRALLGLPAWLCGRPETSYRGLLELSRAAGGVVGWLSPSSITGTTGYCSAGTRQEVEP